MAKPWTNADGLQVPFGNYWADASNFVNKAHYVSTMGTIKELLIDVDFTKMTDAVITYSADLNNDGTVDGFHDGDARLPANASVLSVNMVAKTAATGGTSWVIGTFKKDGTAISANSLMTATEGVIANQNAIGKRIIGAGALVSVTAGTAGVGTANAYVGITPTGTFTAGKSVLVIRYIDPNPEAVAD